MKFLKKIDESRRLRLSFFGGMNEYAPAMAPRSAPPKEPRRDCASGLWSGSSWAAWTAPSGMLFSAGGTAKKGKRCLDARRLGYGLHPVYLQGTGGISKCEGSGHFCRRHP